MSFIQLSDCAKRYHTGGEQVVALDRVSLSIERGDFVAIVGRSGSGKSTLMNLLGCLDRPDEGSYQLEEEDVFSRSRRQLSAIRNRKVGFIFQKFHLIPTLTALENVELQLRYRGVATKQCVALAKEALSQVGLDDRLAHRPDQLSGGQQQRVAIARAIAAAPPLILADEPTGNLDRHAAGAVCNLLCDLHRKGHTVVLITHDPVVARTADRRYTIEDGRLYPSHRENTEDET